MLYSYQKKDSLKSDANVSNASRTSVLKPQSKLDAPPQSNSTQSKLVNPPQNESTEDKFKQEVIEPPKSDSLTKSEELQSDEESCPKDLQKTTSDIDKSLHGGGELEVEPLAEKGCDSETMKAPDRVVNSSRMDTLDSSGRFA